MTNAYTQVKNFYISAHGSPTEIGSGSEVSESVYISAASVAANLGNSTSLGYTTITDHYRFVFLDGCETGLHNNWPRAFGIFPVHNSLAARYKLGPQAYVGWGGDSTAWTTGLYYTNGTVAYYDSTVVGWAYSQTLEAFYSQWVSGAPLAQCIGDESIVDGYQLPLSVRHASPLIPISSEIGPGGIPGGYNLTVYQSYMPPLYVIGHSGLTRTGLDSTYDGEYVRHFWNNW